MRQKDKIEKYLSTLTKIYNGQCAESDKSRYYSFNGRVIRVSDHIGTNSSGNMSIIISNKGTETSYIVHRHSNGNLKLLSYKEVKELVRTFAIMGDIFSDLANNTFEFAMDISQDIKNGNTILGYPKSMFTEGQLNQVGSIIKSLKNKK